MKRATTLLTAICNACLILPAHAQWGTDVQNNGINYEFGIQDNAYSGDNDWDSQADPTIRTDVWLSTYGWIGEWCHAWECTSPCNNYDNVGWWAGGTSYDATFSTWMQGFESDNADGCTWTDGDDQEWDGMGTLRDGASQISFIYPSSDFAPCHWNPNLGNGGSGWLYPNSPYFNQIMRLTWRYAAGDGPTNMLDFGTVAMNTTKGDVNSNQAVATASGVPLQYSNLWGEAAADVFYKFHLDQASTVIISTDHPLTNFDTKIYLASLPGGNLIAEDDDGGSTGNTSMITVQLCAGDYEIIVEGYQSYTGLFRLGVTAQAPVAPAITVLSNSGASCADANDGMVSWSGSGGTAPLSYVVNGVDVGSASTISDFWVGTHTVQVVDACGTVASVTFTVGNADATPPVALCNAALPVNVISGQNTTVDVEDVDNSSSDNCGAVDLSISPSVFNVSDVGLQDIVLTVTDGNGNQSTCTCVALVQNVTGVEEASTPARIRVLPNPNNGDFRLDLSGTHMAANATLTLLDPLGRTVFHTSKLRPVMDIDLGGVPAGAYLLRLADDRSDVTARIVVR